jgi:GDP-L-fucose synthase
MVDACQHVMNLSDAKVEKHLINYPSPCFVNVGTGKDCTIKELAMTVKEQVGFQGNLVFDTSKPDGTPQKLLDVSRLDSLGWKARILLQDGVKDAYEWFNSSF